jgi:hypothetical protein
MLPALHHPSMAIHSSPEAEADALLAMHGGNLAAAIATVAGQFNVIQAREQLLLTLATLTLTITGFSGPKIIESSEVARWSLAAGLVVVLAGVVHILFTLRVRWLTSFAGDDRARLAAALAHRDSKTRAFGRELILLACGLALYVASVVAFIVH